MSWFSVALILWITNRIELYVDSFTLLSIEKEHGLVNTAFSAQSMNLNLSVNIWYCQHLCYKRESRSGSFNHNHPCSLSCVIVIEVITQYTSLNSPIWRPIKILSEHREQYWPTPDTRKPSSKLFESIRCIHADSTDCQFTLAIITKHANNIPIAKMCYTTLMRSFNHVWVVRTNEQPLYNPD